MKRILLLIVLFFSPILTYAKDDINIAFAIDNNYVPHTLLVIDSIFKNNNSGSGYNFYVLQNDISEKNKNRISKFVGKYGHNVKFIDVKTDNIIGKNEKFNFAQNRISTIAMSRIFLPELLPDIDRVIYLDSDILVTADLRELYDTELDGKLLGMVLNISQGEYDNFYEFPHGYYNSGVIVMNLVKCRQHKFTEKLVDYLNNNREKFIYSGGSAEENRNKFRYPDQDLINIVMANEVKSLPYEWNNQTIRGDSLTDERALGIHHYVGPLKPWDFKYFDIYPHRLYLKYWIKSPFKTDCVYYFFNSLWKTYLQICKKRLKHYNTSYAKLT